MTIKRRSQLLRLLRHVRQLEFSSKRQRVIMTIKARLFEQQIAALNGELWARVMAL